MSATTRLSEYATDLRWDDLPSEVQDRARWCLADFVACAIAGRSVQTVAAMLDACSSWADSGSSSVVGEQSSYSPEAAAFLNSFMSEVLEIGHGHGGGAGHLGGPTIPVALALGQQHQLDTTDVLAAIVAGYEVFGRVGLAVSPMLLQDGLIATGLAGAFGAVASASRAQGLSAAEGDSSHGVAAYLAPVSLVNEYYGTINSAEAAQAAWVGIMATRMGVAGIAGGDDPLRAFCDRFGSAERLDQYVAQLGDRYEIMNLYFKPLPGCRFTHGPVEAMTHLLKTVDFQPEDVDTITVRITPASFGLCGRYTQVNAPFVQAQFSIPYVIATLAIDRKLDTGSFTEANLARQEIHDFARQRVVLETAWSDEWSDGGDFDFSAAEIEFVTRAGKREVATVLNPKGSPNNPLSEEDLATKFHQLTEDILGHESAAQLLASIRELGSKNGVSVSALMEAISTSKPQVVA